MKTLVWPRSLLLCCSACVLVPAGNGVKVPPFERVQLGNGAVVLLMERHDVPLIAFSAVVRGGAVSDPAASLGSREPAGRHAARKARARATPSQFAETVASVGGQIETAASTESISVSGSFLARDQQLMVELLADMLQRPRAGAGAVRYAARAAHRVHPRAPRTPISRRSRRSTARRSLFADHPYGRPVDGSEASLAAIKHARAAALLPGAGRRRPADHRRRGRLQDRAAEAAPLARVLRLAQGRRSCSRQCRKRQPVDGPSRAAGRCAGLRAVLLLGRQRRRRRRTIRGAPRST